MLTEYQEIRSLRRALDISQTELGNQLGVSIATISYFEHGKRSISAENNDRLKEFLAKRIMIEAITEFLEKC